MKTLLIKAQKSLLKTKERLSKIKTDQSNIELEKLERKYNHIK